MMIMIMLLICKNYYMGRLDRMVIQYLIGVAFVMEMGACGFRLRANALSMDYYIMTCPMVDEVIRETVSRALERDPTLAGPLLRMHFHDCWIQVST